MTTAVLEVAGLEVTFATRDGPVRAVRGLSFGVEPGEMLAIVGESGSGKTQAAMAMIGLLADNGRVGGSVRFGGEELLGQPADRLNRVRGSRIAMVFQDPMTALNPYLTIGEQMSLVPRIHQGLSRRAALASCAEMLAAVRVTDAGRRLAMYPHELSGGMRQRVMIATALLCRPALLIADEPTTALDVTVQAQILQLMRELREKFGTAILLITHDLGIVAGTCERMLVMHQGACQELGPVDELFYAPQSPYTRELLAAVPRLDALPRGLPKTPPGARPVLTVEDLAVRYRLPGAGLFAQGAELRALDGVALEVAAGETLGVVGESGCGKSTLARAVLHLVTPTRGRVSLLGTDIAGLGDEALREARRNMQLVFQDPLASLDPRMTVREIVAEPLRVFEPDLTREETTARVAEALRQVGLDGNCLNRYPHEFSGGQCQRIGIARALSIRPELVVCDEAVSALDVTIQFQIVSLLMELQARLGIALIFIAHDLAVVRRISHRVLVMYLGRVMELAPAADLFATPRHPYTRALLGAVPIPDPRRERARPRQVLEGEVPSPLSPPSGCPFRPRCTFAVVRCGEEVPQLRLVGGGQVACHRAEEI